MKSNLKKERKQKEEEKGKASDREERQRGERRKGAGMKKDIKNTSGSLSLFPKYSIHSKTSNYSILYKPIFSLSSYPDITCSFSLSHKKSVRSFQSLINANSDFSLIKGVQ